MSYRDWGAFVYRNGLRQEDSEDADIHHDGFGSSYPYHAVLGSGRVLLCGYKHHTSLFVDGYSVDVSSYRVDGDEYSPVYAGVIDGYHFESRAIYHHPASVLLLTLNEPDGTRWTSVCGYERG